jgi:hypothetical protein
MVYTFIAEQKANPDCPWSVTEMCRVLVVSRSGFYDWESRPPSQRELTGRQLTFEIEAIWECSAPTYGAPRVHAWLGRQGFQVSRKRVARIMREQGWEGESGRRKVRTTIIDRSAKAASDRVGPDFNATAPNVTWCGDITYLRTGEGWLYLATVIDLFSRQVIGSVTRRAPAHEPRRRRPRDPRWPPVAAPSRGSECGTGSSLSICCLRRSRDSVAAASAAVFASASSFCSSSNFAENSTRPPSCGPDVWSVVFN